MIWNKERKYVYTMYTHEYAMYRKKEKNSIKRLMVLIIMIMVNKIEI